MGVSPSTRLRPLCNRVGVGVGVRVWVRVLKALACTRPLRIFASTMAMVFGRAQTGEVAVAMAMAVVFGRGQAGEVAVTMATTAAMAVAAIRSMMGEVVVTMAVPVPVPVPVANGERGREALRLSPLPLDGLTSRWLGRARACSTRCLCKGSTPNWLLSLGV